MPDVAGTITGRPDETGVYLFALNGEQRTAEDAAQILDGWQPVVDDDGVTVAFEILWPE